MARGRSCGTHEVVSPLMVQDRVWQVETLQFPDVLTQLGQWDVAQD